MRRFTKTDCTLMLFGGMAILAACGDAGITPEQEVRALVREAEIAAEERSVGDFARLISEEYADRRGNTKESLVRLIRLQMIRNQAIYLLVQTGDIVVTENKRAKALVRVAMAGGPLAGIEDLPKLGAELYRFDLELAKEQGKWRITSASWRQALTNEFR